MIRHSVLFNYRQYTLIVLSLTFLNKKKDMKKLWRLIFVTFLQYIDKIRCVLIKKDIFKKIVSCGQSAQRKLNKIVNFQSERKLFLE